MLSLSAIFQLLALTLGDVMSRFSLFCVGFLSLVSFGFAEDVKQESVSAGEQIAVQENAPAVDEEVTQKETDPVVSEEVVVQENVAQVEEIAQKEKSTPAQEVIELNTSSSADSVEEPLQAKLFGF